MNSNFENIMHNKVYEPLFSTLPYLPSYLIPWKDKSIGELSQNFQHPTDLPLSQKAQEVLFAMVCPTFGHAIAETLIQSLQKRARIIATHHLGIDCLPEQVQCVHFLELQQLLKPKEEITAIPILACSGIPLQSYTYPRGLMPTRTNEEGQSIRYPLYPSTFQNTLVFKAPPLTKDQVEKMTKIWNKNLVSSEEWKTIEFIINDILLQDECLAQKSFSDQIMYANAKIFHSIYPENPNTHVIYINLEELTTQLILSDLEHENSVLSFLFFHKQTRNALLESLQSQRACWSSEAKNGVALERTGNNGTVFFWAVDIRGRRIPLSFIDNPPRLCDFTYITAMTQSGHFHDCAETKGICIELTKEALDKALKEGIIYPSLFTSFISLHLQHNLLCYGGVYMVNYLPVMLKNTLNVLKQYACLKEGLHLKTKITDNINSINIEEESYPPLLHIIERFKLFNAFGSGAITIQNKNAPSRNEAEVEANKIENHTKNTFTPSGSIEIIAHGGITQKNLQKIASLNYDDMLPLNLKEWSILHIKKVKHDTKFLQDLDRACTEWLGINL